MSEHQLDDRRTRYKRDHLFWRHRRGGAVLHGFAGSAGLNSGVSICGSVSSGWREDRPTIWILPLCRRCTARCE